MLKSIIGGTKSIVDSSLTNMHENHPNSSHFNLVMPQQTSLSTNDLMIPVDVQPCPVFKENSVTVMRREAFIIAS